MTTDEPLSDSIHPTCITIHPQPPHTPPVFLGTHHRTSPLSAVYPPGSVWSWMVMHG